jgi:hypothetical protein
VYPNAGLEAWAAATGHPWPEAANPASLPGYPRFKTCVRPAWFDGAPKIKIKSRSKADQKQIKSRSKADQKQSDNSGSASDL